MNEHETKEYLELLQDIQKSHPEVTVLLDFTEEDANWLHKKPNG
jgi:hypothetical protein